MQETHQLPDIRKLVLINVPIGEAWEYISSAAGIASWWRPSTFQPVLGREFILHAGDFGDALCKVTEFDPPKGRHARVGFDWGEDWHVTFRLTRFSTITEFKVIHSGWDAVKATDVDEKRPMFRDIMDSEWEKLSKKQFLQ